MRVGIPPYRLPRNILDNEIEQIKKTGVELRTGAGVESLDGLFAQGYDAAFIAVGAHRGVRMGIDGEDNPGVIDALSFLRQVNLGQCPSVGRSVAIVGGGNSAVDASRTALRLGAEEVTIVYRRTRTEMRAYPEEINEAIREGVNIVFLATPSRIIAEGSRLRMVCLRTKPGSKAADGPPKPVMGSEFTVDAEIIIAAVGQEPEIPQGFSSLLKGKTIQTAPDSMETASTGVFAGADCVTGSSSVIEAIAAGKRAAIAIDRYLGGHGIGEERLAMSKDVVSTVVAEYPIPTAVGNSIPLLPVADRLNGFPLVELSLSPEIAAQEAKRCLQCDLPMVVEETKCTSCFVCQLVCSLRFEGAFDASKAAISILPVTKSDGGVDIRISFHDKCDNCGLCVRYCPFGALARNHLKESA
jgi:formate dehydrogenase beta subunit